MTKLTSPYCRDHGLQEAGDIPLVFALPGKDNLFLREVLGGEIARLKVELARDEWYVAAWRWVPYKVPARFSRRAFKHLLPDIGPTVVLHIYLRKR